MYAHQWIALLTLYQALLAGALPIFRFRQWIHLFSESCDDENTLSSNDVLTIDPILADAAAQQTNTSLYTSAVTFNDPSLSLHTATLTDLPNPQQPTTTNATGSLPDTTGSLITTIQTGGNPPVPPFPTSLPSVTESTLQPLNTTGLPVNTSVPTSITQTITLPLTTYETVITTEVVLTIPVPTTAVITQVTVVESTYTSDGSVITTSSVRTTAITTEASVLVETTLAASITNTSVITTLITTDNPESVSLPTPSPTCLLEMGCGGQDLFQPVAIGQPPANLQPVAGHPVPRLGIMNTTGPIETNKFYSNFHLGLQRFPAFVTPYSLTWSKGTGNAQSWGMAISHIEKDQKVYGPNNDKIAGSPSSYYINPLGIQSLILSSKEMQSQTVLKTDELQFMTGRAHLCPFEGSGPSITFPMASGMGFVTALYNNLKPWVQSSVFFRNVAEAAPPKSGVWKYRLTLEDGKIWLLYAISDSGVPPNFQLISSTLLQGIDNWSGLLQIAKLPDPSSEPIYDAAVGAYPTTGHVGGFAQNSTAEYSLSWDKGGPYAYNTPLLLFALPHQVQSFTQTTLNAATNLTLNTVTKGQARAVLADSWTMRETLPTQMGFAPWRPQGTGPTQNLTAAAVAAIQPVAAIEASQDMNAQTNLNSMYYSGKGLSKFATLCYLMHEMSDQQDLASAALQKLKAAFDVFIQNRQQFPLYYDTDWKGLVSSASYVTGDSGVDFGNSYYNDHHFHYGYFIHAASIIGYLDPSWLPANKDYINALVRDTSNPSSLDQYFPLFRSFDFMAGHSWAKGLYETGDGKDEESSSEDAMYAYALKMWGKTCGDPSMEGRGNLMLAILARSLRNYMLMDSGNQNQPANFIANKVTGILFENKADHTTYFGANPEYIQGIHMIPLLPFSTFTRSQQFVAEEWSTYFVDGAFNQAKDVQGGWKGLLYSNLAIINPVASYNFFTQPDFKPEWIDGGATRSWYIAYAAGLGGGS
jgi:endo-1,3(4)-beta-glucanase